MKTTLTLFLALWALGLTGQPLWSSRQPVAGRIVFKDAKLKNRYYYGPGKLSLAQDRDGKPVFQLISLRYTGTQLTGDKAEKRFTNLLQFGVTMEVLPATVKNEIKTALKLPASAELSPLPIRHLESTIISAVGKTGGEDDLRKKSGSQQEGETGPGVYWTERTFTVPLENHEAQILWDQQANGRVAVSLNYAFYANVLKIQDETVEIKGDSALAEGLRSGIGEIQRDTELVSEAVLSDALNIVIDVNKYPDALKKIDINENSIPPAYAALEVKCFDFELGLRPDLAFKAVEIEGTSVTGTPVTIKTRFSQKQPDLTSRFVSFPYALRMDKPLRFRVREIPYEGDPPTATWQVMPQFSNLVDASTPQGKNPVSKRCIDVEILPEYMADKDLSEAIVYFVYQLGGAQKTQSLSFSRDGGENLKNICLIFETEKPLQYFVTRKYADGRKTKGLLKTPAKDDYILISR